jgi:hypothetical protein
VDNRFYTVEFVESLFGFIESLAGSFGVEKAELDAGDLNSSVNPRILGVFVVYFLGDVLEEGKGLVVVCVGC